MVLCFAMRAQEDWHKFGKSDNKKLYLTWYIVRFSNPSLINTIICETGGYNACQTKANGKVIFHHATAQPILVNIIQYTIRI